MRIISKKAILNFIEIHKDSETALLTWYRVLSKSSFNNIAEVRKFFSSADPVGNLTVFNIRGNNYRLIVKIDYENQLVFIRDILTHVEYDTEKWKKDEWF